MPWVSKTDISDLLNLAERAVNNSKQATADLLKAKESLNESSECIMDLECRLSILTKHIELVHESINELLADPDKLKDVLAISNSAYEASEQLGSHKWKQKDELKNNEATKVPRLCYWEN